MKTLKEMKQEIKEKYASIPEKQIETGLYLNKIGRLYVTILNTWNESTIERMPIEDFYNEYL